MIGGETISEKEEKPVWKLDPIRSYLLQSPPVIESIFKFLPARDLSSCAKVCRSWNVMAKTNKKKRTLVSIIPECDEILLEGRFSEISSELFNEPHLAIYFNEKIRVLFVRSVGNDEDHRPPLIERYRKHKQEYDALRREEERGYDFNDCLPTKCTLVVVAALVDGSLHPTKYNMNRNSKAMILIPSIIGIEIEQFSLPIQYELCLCDRQIVPLLLTREMNSLQSKIKCLVLFLDKYSTESLSHIFTNRMCEDTIVIQYHGFVSNSSGISIAGDRVRVACVLMNRKRCCIKYCFSVLLSQGFDEEYGLAFCKTHGGWKKDESRIYIKEAFELFPKIVVPNEPLNLYFFPHSVMYTTVTSLEKCNECGSLQDGSDCGLDPVVIVFILFEDISVEIINN